MKKHLQSSFLAALLLVPASVLADYTPRAWSVPGGNYTITGLIGNALVWMRAWIVPLAITIFLLGAFWMIIFSWSDTGVTQGKTMIKKALIGMSIALMAYSILQIIFFILGI
jgi:hypothetical protein